MSGIHTSRGQENFKTPLSLYPNDISTDFAEYITGQNVGGRKRAVDTIGYGAYPVSTGNLIAAGSTQRVIKKVAHGARKNDFVTFTTGENAGISIQILSCPDADTVILSSTPEQTSAIGDAFSIKRPILMELSSTGAIPVAIAGGSTELKQDAQIVQETLINTNLGSDIAAPTAMPAGGVGVRGWLSAIWTKLNGTLAVTGTVTSIDQVQTGSFDEDLTVTTTPETFIAPAGAFACFIEAKDSNPVNIRVKMGAVAGVASGIQFQAGRSEFYQGGSNISYCNESGAVGELSVQWFIKT